MAIFQVLNHILRHLNDAENETTAALMLLQDIVQNCRESIVPFSHQLNVGVPDSSTAYVCATHNKNCRPVVSFEFLLHTKKSWNQLLFAFANLNYELCKMSWVQMRRLMVRKIALRLTEAWVISFSMLLVGVKFKANFITERSAKFSVFFSRKCPTLFQSCGFFRMYSWWSTQSTDGG